MSQPFAGKVTAINAAVSAVAFILRPPSVRICKQVHVYALQSSADYQVDYHESDIVRPAQPTATLRIRPLEQAKLTRGLQHTLLMAKGRL